MVCGTIALGGFVNDVVLPPSRLFLQSHPFNRAFRKRVANVFSELYVRTALLPFSRLPRRACRTALGDVADDGSDATPTDELPLPKLLPRMNSSPIRRRRVDGEISCPFSCTRLFDVLISAK